MTGAICMLRKCGHHKNSKISSFLWHSTHHPLSLWGSLCEMMVFRWKGLKPFVAAPVILCHPDSLSYLNFHKWRENSSFQELLNFRPGWKNSLATVASSHPCRGLTQPYPPRTPGHRKASFAGITHWAGKEQPNVWHWHKPLSCGCGPGEGAAAPVQRCWPLCPKDAWNPLPKGAKGPWLRKDQVKGLFWESLLLITSYQMFWYEGMTTVPVGGVLGSISLHLHSASWFSGVRYTSPQISIISVQSSLQLFPSHL